MALSRPLAAPIGARLPSAPRWRRYAMGYALVAPAVLLVLGMFAYPLAYEVQLSLTDARTTASTADFVGLGNYASIAGDSVFWVALRNTAFVVLITTCAALLLGLAVALLLWRPAWLRPVLFAAVFLPWVYPSTFANYTWYWMLLPPFHTFYTLDALRARFWLEGIFGEQAYHILSFVLVGVWRGSSIVAVLVLAGLRSIPRDQLDYARLEIGNPLRYFWSVVFPLARRFFALAILVAITVTYIDYLAMYIETNGRITVPILGTLVYKAELVDGRLGYAAALSLTQLPIVVLLLLVLFPALDVRFSRWRTREESAALRDASFAFTSSPGRDQPSRATSQPSAVPKRQLRYFGTAARSLGCLAIAAFYLLPLYYTAVQSVKSREDFIGGPLGQPFWPYALDFADGWTDTMQSAVFWRAALNTALVFGSVVVIGIAVALLAAYALARLRLPGAGWLSRLLFATYFIPQLAVVVPLLQTYAEVGLENTIPGIVLVYLTLAIPFATWLFLIYFQSMDVEPEDHALLDANRWRVFIGVVLPRSWPVITAAAIFGVGMMASDLLYARLFTLTSATRTLPVTMGSMVYDPDIWSDANASILAGAIPLLVAGLALGHIYLRGLTSAFSDQ